VQNVEKPKLISINILAQGMMVDFLSRLAAQGMVGLEVAIHSVAVGEGGMAVQDMVNAVRVSVSFSLDIEYSNLWARF
jgi:hypothetical protein